VVALIPSSGPPPPMRTASERARQYSAQFKRRGSTAPPSRRVWCAPSNRTLRIIAAGLGRSGSTWQFNVLYSALWLAGLHPASAHGQLLSTFTHLNDTLNCPVSVVKVHQFHPELLSRADYIFTSHRDPRDALISLIDLGASTSWTECVFCTTSLQATQAS